MMRIVPVELAAAEAVVSSNSKTIVGDVRISTTQLGKSVTMPDGRVLDILSAIDLAVNAGEVVAILGPSGSGKSTLLGLLAGLDRPTHGEVSLLGRTLNGMDEDERAALRAGRVGFVFQSFQLLPGMTALENVAMPLLIRGETTAVARQRASEILDRVGLAERLDHKPGELSGGERQRAAVARALVGNPAIMLGDEPTGNLDERTAEHVYGLMLELNRELQTSLLLVTHDRTLAARMDRRLELHLGRLHAMD